MLFDPKDFPNLHSGNHHDTGERTIRYNCIGWAVGRDDQWWDPAEPEEWEGNFYWPENVSRGLLGCKVPALISAFATVGFVFCADGTLEDGIEKIVLYADGAEWMHAARQLATGKWPSKIGPDERIEHDTSENLVGPAFGQVAAFMKRARTI